MSENSVKIGLYPQVRRNWMDCTQALSHWSFTALALTAEALIHEIRSLPLFILSFEYARSDVACYRNPQENLGSSTGIGEVVSTMKLNCGWISRIREITCIGLAYFRLPPLFLSHLSLPVYKHYS